MAHEDELISNIVIPAGKWIVFEGLDATGKTTQLDKLRNAGASLFGDELLPFFTHQPSGGTPLGSLIYQITEEVKITSALARQFLHLASHAEHYQVVISHEMKRRAVFQDRFWWSTIAYGWFGGGLQESEEIALRAFLDVCRWPVYEGLETVRSGPLMPDVIFLFDHPWQDDPHNNANVASGYGWLMDHFTNASDSECTIVRVPPLDEGEVTKFIFETLSVLKIADVEWVPAKKEQ